MAGSLDRADGVLHIRPLGPGLRENRSKIGMEEPRRLESSGFVVIGWQRNKIGVKEDWMIVAVGSGEVHGFGLRKSEPEMDVGEHSV